MKKQILGLMVLVSSAVVTSATAFAHPETPGVVPVAKAVELGVHRIERLVTLKKIDAMFGDHLYSLRAERTTDAGATYKVIAYSQPDAGNNSSALSMMSDNKGKVMSESAGAVVQPANPVMWPDVDSATLMEDGLHFVLEGWATYPDVKAFFLGLTSITMTPGLGAQGEMIANFTVTSDDDPRTLYIRLKTDGTFISHEIK